MQYKRILISCLIVILILCSSIVAVSAAEETPLKVSVGVADATPAVLNSGEKFDVSITIDSNPGLEVFKVEVEYDSANLKLVSVTNGDVFVKSSDTAVFPKIDSTENLVKFQYIDMGDAVDKTGTVMTIQFEALKSVSPKNSVRIVEDQLSAMDDQNVAYGSKFDDATVAIEGNPEKLHGEVTSEVIAPTCTEGGKTVHTCTCCGETFETDVVAPLGHTEVVIPAVAANCTDKGLTEGKKCSVCGEILVAQKEVAAKGHTEEVIPAVEPTEDKDGATEGKKCSVCGEILDAPETVTYEKPVKNLTWLWILIAVVVVAGAGVAVYFFVIKKKKTVA